MAILGSATYKLDTDNSRLNRGLAKAEKSTAESMKRNGKRMTVGLTAPILAGAVVLLKVVDSYDRARRTLAFSTGASGKALAGLMSSFRALNGVVDASMTEISTSLGDFNTVLGLTGKPLEEASRNALILGLDSRLAARGMQIFGVDAKDAGFFIDQLGLVSRATGAPINDLANSLREYGPVLKNAGFETKEAIAFLGSLDKAGINASRVFPGLNATLRRLAAEGVPDLKAALSAQIEAIRTTTDDTEALDKATEFFGAEGAQRLVVAIRNNVFEFSALERAMDGAKGSTVEIDEATRTAGQQVSLFTAQIKESIAHGWQQLPFEAQLGIGALGGFGAAMGPVLTAVGMATIAFQGLAIAQVLVIGKFVLIALAVVALVAAGVWLVKNWDKVKTSLVSAFDTVLAWVQPVVDAFALWAENNPKLMRALVVARQAVEGLTMALGWLRQQAQDAWEELKAWAEDIWEKHLKPIWEKFKEIWAEHVEPAVLWLVEKFEGLPGAMQLALLGVAAGLAASMTAMLAVWVAKMLAHLAIWIATSLARMAAWAVAMLVRFAVFIVASLARMALWPAKMLVHLAVWIATSLARMAVWAAGMLARFAVWTVTSLARMAVWTARMLVMFSVWAARMFVIWLVALGPVGLIIAAVALLAGGAFLLMANWESIDGRWRELWDGLKVKAVGVLNDIIAKLNEVIELWNQIPVVPDIGGIGPVDPNSIGTPSLEDAINIAGWAVPGLGGLKPGTLLRKGAEWLGGAGGDGADGIPGFTSGGIVTGPTLARLGEAGPEAVVPLNGKGGLGGGLTIIFQGDVYGGEDFGDRVRDAVDEATRRGVVFGAV